MTTLFGIGMLLLAAIYGYGVWRDDREMRQVERALAQRIADASRPVRRPTDAGGEG